MADHHQLETLRHSISSLSLQLGLPTQEPGRSVSLCETDQVTLDDGWSAHWLEKSIILCEFSKHLQQQSNPLRISVKPNHLKEPNQRKDLCDKPNNGLLNGIHTTKYFPAFPPP